MSERVADTRAIREELPSAESSFGRNICEVHSGVDSAKVRAVHLESVAGYGTRVRYTHGKRRNICMQGISSMRVEPRNKFVSCLGRRRFFYIIGNNDELTAERSLIWELYLI